MAEETTAGPATARQPGWHHRPAVEVLDLLATDANTGLTRAEASRRLATYGPNAIKEEGGPSLAHLVLRQFMQPLIVVLLVAAVGVAALEDYLDAAVILAVVVVNATIGAIQEGKAVRAIAALSASVPFRARVIRDGQQEAIAAAELVPGDIIVIEAGERVPADARLVEARALRADESALTGEAESVPKSPDPVGADTILPDRRNMLYASTTVTAGQGKAVVVATGNETQLGHISRLLAGAEGVQTPLTRQIAAFSKVLLVVIIAVAAVQFGVGYARGGSAAEMLVAAVALAVATIPEGLPAVISITLAIGVTRMARRKAIMRSLPAVETLGSTTVICTDKTGTLTQNRMTVAAVWTDSAAWRIEDGRLHAASSHPRDGRRRDPGDDEGLSWTLRAGVLCNDAAWKSGGGTPVAQGDPTETALLYAAAAAGIDVQETRSRYPRVDTLPFDPGLRIMATLHRDEDGYLLAVKGAVEAVIPFCEAAMGAAGEEVSLGERDVQEAADRIAADGLRVLALAVARLGEPVPLADASALGGLVFAGLQGMADPPRPEAITAVARCREAGIRVVMVTGDHAATAVAIAQQVGITGKGDHHVVTGAEVEGLSQAELEREAARTRVFARVTPHAKLRLVQAYQSLGHVVAMTGDGVNDAPALRQAHIGVAMGLSGTDIAREAADMVLADDNFASIEAAVEEGRAVFENIQKFIVWVLPTNVAEGFVILVAVLAGLTLPVLPAQILWINMATAVFLGLALAFEPPAAGLMQRPPRRPNSPIIPFRAVERISVGGGLLIASVFVTFEVVAAARSDEAARTAAATAIVLGEVALLFNSRSLTGGKISPRLFLGRWVLLGSVTMIAAQAAFIYAPPMQALFRTEAIGIEAWALSVGFAVLIFLVVEVHKLVRPGWLQVAKPPD